MRHLETYSDREIMMLDLADKVASELADALRHHDRVSFCVPGGTTPGPLFDVLCEQALDWDRVTVFLNDERCVPVGHDRSNTKLLMERLLTSKAAAATLLPLYDTDADLDQLAAALKRHVPISVLMLGMGADMHTASLFPTAPNIKHALSAEAPVLLEMTPEGQPETRISLAGHVLAGAMSKHIVITGDEKRKALEKAALLPVEDAPIRAVWADATVHWAP